MRGMQILSMPNKIDHSPVWHARRKTGIGGSESAAVLGVSKWRTAYQVWLDKTGQAEPTEPNEAMRTGTILEKSIREMYSNETGRTVYDPGFKVDEDYPFIVGDVDGLCDDRVVEIKNSGYEWDEIPVDYYFQVQHYMRLHKKDIADIAVLFHGQVFRIFTVKRQEDLWKDIIPIYTEFWNCVTSITPPELTNLEDVNTAYRQSQDTSITLSGTAIEALEKIKELKASIAEQEQIISSLEFNVKQELGENAVGTDENGRTLVTWRTSKETVTFDRKRFEAEHKDLFDEYKTTGATRRPFLVK